MWEQWVGAQAVAVEKKALKRRLGELVEEERQGIESRYEFK